MDDFKEESTQFFDKEYIKDNNIKMVIVDNIDNENKYI